MRSLNQLSRSFLSHGYRQLYTFIGQHYQIHCFGLFYAERISLHNTNSSNALKYDGIFSFCKMPRKHGSANGKSLKYFAVIDGELDTYKCGIENCGRIISGKQKSNLVVHIKTKHSAIYESEFKLKNEPELEYKRLKMMQHLTEIVTINGRPFSYLSDSGLLNLIKDDLDILENAGMGIKIRYKDYSEVQEYIRLIAAHYRNTISREVLDKFLTLMIDITRKNNRSILGITIQYMADDIFKIRSIGMIEMVRSHSGVYIKELIVACANVYGIDIDQIFAVVTDNGKNVVASVDRLTELIADNDDDAELRPQGIEQYNAIHAVSDNDSETIDNQAADVPLRELDPDDDLDIEAVR